MLIERSSFNPLVVGARLPAHRIVGSGKPRRVFQSPRRRGTSAGDDMTLEQYQRAGFNPLVVGARLPARQRPLPRRTARRFQSPRRRGTSAGNLRDPYKADGRTFQSPRRRGTSAGSLRRRNGRRSSACFNPLVVGARLPALCHLSPGRFKPYIDISADPTPYRPRNLLPLPPARPQLPSANRIPPSANPPATHFHSPCNHTTSDEVSQPPEVGGVLPSCTPQRFAADPLPTRFRPRPHPRCTGRSR